MGTCSRRLSFPVRRHHERQLCSVGLGARLALLWSA
jgi:hypothetical protein